MALSAYPIDPTLTAIAIAYRNPGYIADMVLPRILVGKQKFSFLQYATDTFFNVPETLVGRRSRPNQVTLDATEVTDATDDHALDGGVPRADIENADERYDPLGGEVAYIMELTALRREMRAAGIVFSAATYDAALKQTLAGSSQFSDPSSSPIELINKRLDEPLMRPTQMVFGQAGWTTFRSNPSIVEAVLGTGAKKGSVTKQAVADLFEVQEVVVGMARGNSAKKGQAPQLSRLWGNHLALLHKSPVPQAKGAVTFGGTFQWGGPEASQWEDKNMGMRGGVACRAGESVKERVIAGQCGFFFENAFA